MKSKRQAGERGFMSMTDFDLDEPLSCEVVAETVGAFDVVSGATLQEFPKFNGVVKAVTGFD